MIQLLIATRNAHKSREFQQMLGSSFSGRDLSAYPDFPETAESGKTFAQNATLKAVAASEKLPGFILADDSGLEVDALQGRPGIFSARYAGANATDKQNLDKLLAELIGATNRKARFVCVLVLARDGKVLATFEGLSEGMIIDAPRGSAGFGYDPVFLPNGFEQTFAELPEKTKNQISHRARAVEQLTKYLNAE